MGEVSSLDDYIKSRRKAGRPDPEKYPSLAKIYDYLMSQGNAEDS